MRKATVLCALALLSLGALAEAQADGKIPITTSSPEARALYLKGRDLVEKLRGTDALKLFEEALAKDKSFALAELALANSAPSAKEFFAHMKRAVALAGKVSEGERLLILASDAGGRGDVAAQKDLLTKLVAAAPDDERAHNVLGVFYLGQQDWAAATAEYQKAIAIDASYTAPYNQLGYAYRFMGKYPEAEQAFKKYIQLIPDDPNPYDSYAELLMKMGRFEESIKSYEKALAVDPKFVPSLVGIGNDQIFLGRGAEARKTFARLAEIARNTGETRQANFWTAMSWVHEGATDKALAELQKNVDISQKLGDLGTVAADYGVMGNILLEAGRADDAAARFKAQLDTIAKSDVPEDNKQATRRNGLFEEARVALARKDLKTAKAKAAAYAEQVAKLARPFEVWQQHELAGLILLEEKSYAKAAAELAQANQQDPRALYAFALALKGAGDETKARDVAALAANFNGLAPNYAFVRAKAKALLAKS